MEGGDSRRMLTAGVQDKTIINRIMLRFRPIAPKPVSGDSVSGESTFCKKNSGVTSKRVKRKYVRVCTKNNSKRLLDEAKEDNHGNITLQLMPVKSDLEKSTVFDKSQALDDDLDRTVVNDYYQSQDPPSPFNKRVSGDREEVAVTGLWDPRVSITSSGVVESWVTVESVTDSCMGEGEMWNCTDVERMRNLEKDTCPGFLSDGSNRVFWVSEGYKKMVGGEGAETAVRLDVKEGFKFPEGGAFSCRVVLQYGDGKRRKKMVPCDVWKMSFGGLAWKLDVKAALSLGL